MKPSTHIPHIFWIKQLLLFLLTLSFYSCENIEDEEKPRERYVFKSTDNGKVEHTTFNPVFEVRTLKQFEIRTNEVLRAFLDVDERGQEKSYEIFDMRFIPKDNQYIPGVQNYYMGRLELEGSPPIQVEILLSLKSNELDQFETTLNFSSDTFEGARTTFSTKFETY